MKEYRYLKEINTPRTEYFQIWNSYQRTWIEGKKHAEVKAGGGWRKWEEKTGQGNQHTALLSNSIVQDQTNGTVLYNFKS